MISNELSDYKILLDLIIQLIESQANKELADDQRWLGDAQTLACKLFGHLTTMDIIAKGIMVGHNGISAISIIDHSSHTIVTRAALETYLVFYNIFVCDDKPLSSFRHKTWCLGGLKDRQKFHAFTPEGKQKLAEEREQIHNLLLEIKSSHHYNNLSDKQRKAILHGNWRAGDSWSSLAKYAGFHDIYFRDIYSYICGYSHSSYLSILQIDQARSIDEQRQLTQLMVKVGLVLMSHFIYNYPKVFSAAKSILANNSEAIDIAQLWYFNKQNMTPIYNPELELSADIDT